MSASVLIVASEIGNENAACGYFDFAVLMDLADVAGNVSDGVHIASTGRSADGASSSASGRARLMVR